MRRPSLSDIAMFLMLVVIVGLVGYIIHKENQITELLAGISTHTPAQDAVDAPTPPPKDDTAITPHTDAIKAIESDIDVFLTRVAKLIIADEGKRTRPYLDSAGQVTIGVGRSLSTNGISVAELHALADDIDYQVVLTQTRVQNGRVYIHSLPLAERIFSRPLTEHDIQLLLTDDLRNVAKEARKVFPKTWQRLDAVRREVIVDTLFNLGLPHFKEFVNFISAVKASDWDKASVELLSSQAARKNVVRYHRNATVLRTGDARYFGL